MVYKIFYKPDDGVCADFIPFYENGEFHLFYLKDWRDIENHGEGTPWYHISTKNFYDFSNLGEAIPRGSENEQDLYVFTGSVIKALGQYHIFYTGHNPHLENSQEAVMHAVSDDLNNWTKIPGDILYPAEKYDHCHFRDPFVYYDKDDCKYKMLLVSRYNSHLYNAGFTAVYSSDDLKNWHDEGEFFSPQMYHTHECPDLFKMGGKWYLLFSEYSDINVTHYAISDSPDGPWEIRDSYYFDSTMYYAAKTAENDGKRYLFGWIGTRHKCNDDNYREWGGNLAVHEIIQHKDGTLGCKLPESLNNIWMETARFKDVELKSAEKKERCLAFSNCGDTWKLDTDIYINSDFNKFGMAFEQNFDTDHGYKFEFDSDTSSVRFGSNTFFMQSYQLTRHVPVKAGEHLHITMIKEKDICVLYVNDTALSTRMYAPKGEDVSFYSIGGNAEFKNTVLYKLKN